MKKSNTGLYKTKLTESRMPPKIISVHISKRKN